MTRPFLPLSIALSDNPNTRPLIDGDIAPEGIQLTPTAVHPSEMFWRQLRFAEFDVSEMSMSSLLIATAHHVVKILALRQELRTCDLELSTSAAIFMYR